MPTTPLIRFVDGEVSPSTLRTYVAVYAQRLWGVLLRLPEGRMSATCKLAAIIAVDAVG